MVVYETIHTTISKRSLKNMKKGIYLSIKPESTKKLKLGKKIMNLENIIPNKK